MKVEKEGWMNKQIASRSTGRENSEQVEKVGDGLLERSTEVHGGSARQ